MPEHLMQEHVMQWIEAYYDGELPEDRAGEVAEHLEICASCRRVLDDLRTLSGLLRAEPLPRLVESDTSFAEHILDTLEGQRPPQTPLSWQRVLRAAWQWAPASLFVGWAFGQAVVWMSGLLLVTGQAVGVPLARATESLLFRLPPFLTPFLTPAPIPTPGSGLLVDLLRLASDYLPGSQEMAYLVSGAGPIVTLAVVDLALMALLAILFLSWLASWWVMHQAKTTHRAI